MSRTYEDVIAWQKAHSFVVLAYSVIAGFPEYERYGLSDQFRRSSMSIPANIAEGYKRLHKGDKLRFFNVAQGSLEESRYYCRLALDLHYISPDTYARLTASVEEASRFLNAYIQGVVNDNAQKSHP